MRISGDYPWGSERTPKFVLRVLSLGAGVQSSCLLWMMLHGEFGQDHPKHAIFADTGSEPPAVYDYLETLQAAARGRIRFHIVTAGNLGKAVLRSTVSDARFAAVPFYVRGQDGSVGMGRRQCTREYKIEPIAKCIRQLVGAKRMNKKKPVECWQGISYDEMGRIREPRYTWQWSRYPLVERRMTRAACLQWIQERNLPIPPKSACYFCPYRDDAAWAAMKAEQPEVWEKAVAFDEALRAAGPARGMKNLQYLHSTALPLADAPLKVGDCNQLSLFNQECEGFCGV